VSSSQCLGVSKCVCLIKKELQWNEHTPTIADIKAAELYSVDFNSVCSAQTQLLSNVLIACRSTGGMKMNNMVSLTLSNYYH